MFIHKPFLKLISDFSEKSFNNFLSVVKVSKLNSGDGEIRCKLPPVPYFEVVACKII